MLVKQGKVKDVFEVDDKTDELEFVFSDRISVFDKIIPSIIPYKGETLCRTSAYWFKTVNQLGILTHYLGLVNSNRMRVRRVRVISDYNQLTPKTSNYLIPLEVVTRYFVYGSLWDRVKQGIVKSEQLGFPPNYKIAIGEPLPQPYLEVTTKLEKVDRYLDQEEALRISGLLPSEFQRIKEIALTIDQEIDRRVKPRGLIHVDGKKEFAFDLERNLMVVDTFGTADEDRFWDAKEYEQGRFVERSKELARQYYRDIGYYDQLIQARRDGKEEPDIPPLPDDMRWKLSRTYVNLFQDITGESFFK